MFGVTRPTSGVRATVKRFLTDRGIDASRIEIVSYGEERPAVQGEGEDAWSKNRRAELKDR